MTFSFSPANQKLIEQHIAKYPPGRQQSALLPVLDIAQRQNEGWLSMACLESVAEVLNLSVLKVHEVASFYSMFHLHPVGKYHIQVCGTTPCMLRGAEDLIAQCKKHLGIKGKEVTTDGLFSLEEVECLGACVNAPVVQINDDFFEDLSEDDLLKILENCRKGKILSPFSAKKRQGSAPEGFVFGPLKEEEKTENASSKKTSSPKRETRSLKDGGKDATS